MPIEAAVGDGVVVAQVSGNVTASDPLPPKRSAGNSAPPNSAASQKLGGQKKLGGAKTRRGNSTENVAPPRKSGNSAPPSFRKKVGRWIEFKPGTIRKDGTRLYYPKYRQWLPGNNKKKWLGSVPDLDPMTESEKFDYVNKQRGAKKRRKQRKNG